MTTIFDSTFVILGIMIGLALTNNAHTKTVIATILTSTVAMGISTGISIFEAERLEQDIRLRKIERALLSSLEGTDIQRMSRASITLIAIINFCAPILTGLITLAPFLLLPQDEISMAAWLSVGLAIALLFVVGAVMGRLGEKNPLLQGGRMVLIGVFAFVVCFILGSYL